MSVRVIDRGWKQIQHDLKKIDKSYVKIGVISGGGNKKYTDRSSVPSKGGNNESGGSLKMDMAELATVHEFGNHSRRLPSRPFIRQAFDTKRSLINRYVDSLFNRIIKGNASVKGSLAKLGLFHQANTRKIFTQGSFQPNKPATVKKKGSSRPLIDTGRLRQSIDYEVKIN